MELNKMLESMHREVSSRAARRRYSQARSHHHALEPFADPNSVIDFLHDRRPEAAEARSEVTRALVHEAQRRKQTIWSSMLVVAFGPVLRRYSYRTARHSDLDREEGEALVVECFLHVVNTLPLETQGRFAVSNLVRGTHKAITAELRRSSERQRAEQAWVDRGDELVLGEVLSLESELVKREEEQALDLSRLRARFLKLCRDEPEGNVALLMETFATGTPLISYVREQYPEASDQELRQQYERFRRRRSRVFRRLRALANDVAASHCDVDPALRTQEANDERSGPEIGDHVAPHHPRPACADGALQRRPAADRAHRQGAEGDLPSSPTGRHGRRRNACQARDGTVARRAGSSRCAGEGIGGDRGEDGSTNARAHGSR